MFNLLLQNIWPVLLKTVKVIKKKESLKNDDNWEKSKEV